MNATVHDYLSLLGYLLLRHGKTSRAISILEALLALQPGNLWARRTLAYAFLEDGRHEQCLQELDLVAASGTTEASDQLLRSRALWALNRQQEAREIIRTMNGNLRNLDAR